MWILKGSMLGMWLFGFGTIANLYLRIYRHLEPHTSVDARSIGLLTVSSPMWWAALAVCLILGLAIARSWSGPLSVWIALLVTGLIPAGFLALFLVLIVKLLQPWRGCRGRLVSRIDAS